jgi:outer membrane protein
VEDPALTRSRGHSLHRDLTAIQRKPARPAEADRVRRLSMTATALACVVLFAGTRVAHSQARASFDEADANHDGRVTLQEFETYATKRLMAATGPVAQKFKHLSPQDQEARLQKRFEEADKGHKGYLDRTDWDAAEIRGKGPSGALRGVPKQGLSLGAGVIEADPGYIGYHHRSNVVPLVSYRSGPFFISGTEGGVVATQSDDYTLSFGLVPELNRLRASDSPELAGLQTREWTIDGSMNLSVRQPWGDTSFAVLHDILDRNNGTELRANYSYPIVLGTGRLTPAIGVTWESTNLTNYYYGVNTAESLPNRPAYSPGSALNPTAQLDYSVPVSDRWSLGAGIGYTHFDGTIRDSPIVDRSGSLSGMISLVYSFSPGANASAPTPVMPLEH